MNKANTKHPNLQFGDLPTGAFNTNTFLFYFWDTEKPLPLAIEREHVHHILLELGDPLGDVTMVLEAVCLVRRAHGEELGEDHLANLLGVTDTELAINGDLADDGLETLLAQGLLELFVRSRHDIIQAVCAVHLVLILDGMGDLVELVLRRHDLRLLLLVLKGHIASANVTETVEEKVDALRVIAGEERKHCVGRYADMGALIVDVECVDNRAEIIVDVEVVIPADVFGRVNSVRLVSDLLEEALDSGGVITHAGEVAHKVPVDALSLTLDVSEVKVAGAAEQLHLVGVVGLDDLEARRLRVDVANSTQRKAGALGHVEVFEELAEVAEDTRKRARQAVRVGLLDVTTSLVVEGPDVIDIRAFNHLKVDLGVLKDELVSVIRVQLARERAVSEDGVHAVNLEEAFVEEVADGALADPIVVVCVDGAVRRQAPIIAVEVCANQSPREILGGGNGPDDRALGRNLLRLGKAEALDVVRLFDKDGPDGVGHGSAEVGGLGLGDHIRSNDHKAVAFVELKHTAVLGEEVVLHVGEGLGRQGGDVGGEERHFKWMFEKLGVV